jgi:hypothetical protein
MQIADNSEACPYCKNPINHKIQVVKEIKLRRYQRWIFYFLGSVVFLGMLVWMLKIYSDNTKLVNSITQTSSQLEEARSDLEAKESELNSARSSLASQEGQLKDYLNKITAKDAELGSKTEELKKVLDDKAVIDKNYEQVLSDLDSANANIFSLIIKLGVGISNNDLKRIKVADANFDGTDTDQDGLSDLIEKAIGTDINNADSDSDGFNDKSEVVSGFNPVGGGSWPIDNVFAGKNKGRILLQVESDGEAWYVASDGLRYFLGIPADGFRTMRNLDYWKKDWNK